MLPMLNRVALIVRPRQPYADWASGEDPVTGYVLAEHRNEPEVFLLLESACDDVPAAIEEHWKTIFDRQLGAWSTDKKTWPRKRTLVMFREWFDVELGEPIWDLGDDELETEDL